MSDFEKFDLICGDALGLPMPAHGDALRALGPDFLTQAFHAFGSLQKHNRVVEITRMAPFDLGSTGQKFYLSVRYEHEEPTLHKNLFVKFSRDFTSSTRDRGRFEMQAEARFARVSKLDGFPISVPIAYFADFHDASGTGIIISQSVEFGANGIESQRRKCMDQELDNPIAYYRALVTALARLAAAHKAGRLGDDIETLFPLQISSAGADPISLSCEDVRRKVQEAAELAERYPKILPASLRDKVFMQNFESSALKVLEHEGQFRAFLTGDQRLIALCHWNAHIDNAWFWRDQSGLTCGLLDWGRVGQITFGAALWGCLSAAHDEVWQNNLDELIHLFVEEYRGNGGPDIEPSYLLEHFKLHLACMMVARLLAFPHVILSNIECPEEITGRFDPAIQANDRARNALHIYSVLLEFWRRGDVDARIDSFLSEATGR